MSEKIRNKEAITRVVRDGEIFAIILRSTFETEGIEFVTPNDFSQQLGYMKRPKGYVIPPHIHKIRNDSVKFTNETLFVRNGKIKVNFYDNDKVYFESQIIETGDVILLAKGGHGFEMLEPSEIIEVKQGPYNGDADKERF